MRDKLSWKDRQLFLIVRLDLWEDEKTSTLWRVGDCIGLSATSGLRICDVEVPFRFLPKGNEKGAILDHARAQGVFAASLGLLDDATLRTHPGIQYGQQPAPSTKE
jgi:hypothetical protein